MASTSYTPLKIIIFCTVILTLLYGSQALFGDVETADDYRLVNYDYPDDGTISDQTYNDSNFSYAGEDSQGFIDILTDIGEFATFGNYDNWAIRLFFSLFSTCLFITLGYTIIALIRQYIPFMSG